MREGGSMASRRSGGPPSSSPKRANAASSSGSSNGAGMVTSHSSGGGAKVVSPEHSHPLKGGTGSVDASLHQMHTGKNSSSSNSHKNNANVVVCLVFFSLLANHARSVTGQIWHYVAHMDKRELVGRLCKLTACAAVLVAIPLFVLQEIPPYQSFGLHLLIVWNALLHVSIWPVAAFTAAVAIKFALQHTSTMERTSERRKSLAKNTLLVVVVTAALLIVNCQIQVIAPSWLWNPFLWGRYKLYLPQLLDRKLKGVCLDDESRTFQDSQVLQEQLYDVTSTESASTNKHNNKNHPLCLNEASWQYLSAGALTSTNPKDVHAVRKGLQWAQRDDGGLILNVMARDVFDSIPSLKQNVEALTPFFKHLAVVVFENDSSDGTREAFQQWSQQQAALPQETRGYTVDVLDCGPNNPDCKFGISHRYDALEAKDYFTSSAIGKMAVFRQKLVDYVIGKDKRNGSNGATSSLSEQQLQYQQHFSHMMVIDLDLKVSLSPLGILHTLGTVPDVPVASSGRQVWPGSLGSMTPPYDFSAFRAIPTPQNQHLLDIHGWFCGLLPAGDRWRNQCDAASSIHLLFVLLHDWLLTEEPYPTESAFNGATLYPLDLIQQTDAQYDAGDDGQRCEHIGFNMALQKPTYVNPKWNFHVMPTNPGGPTGVRSLKSVFRIVFMPRLSMVIFFQLIVFLVTFVLCIMCMTLALVEPMVAAISMGSGGMGKLKETTMSLPLYHESKNDSGLTSATNDSNVVIPVDDFSLAKRHVSGAAKRNSSLAAC